VRDPESVARARYAAIRLEQAWERWRARHQLAGPPDPLTSYVGSSMREPMGEPRVVVGVGAAEAAFLADFLDQEEHGRGGQAEAPPGGEAVPVTGDATAAAPQAGPSAMAARLQDEPPDPPAGEADAGSGAPAASGHHATDNGAHTGPALVTCVLRQMPAGPIRPQDIPSLIAADLAGWASGELPGQASKRLASWAAAGAAPAGTADGPDPAR